MGESIQLKKFTFQEASLKCSYFTIKKPKLDFLVYINFHLILINKSIIKEKATAITKDW